MTGNGDAPYRFPMLADLPDKPYLNVRETAKVLDCTPQTLRNRVRAGTCQPSPVEGTKPPKWRRADFIAAHGAA